MFGRFRPANGAGSILQLLGLTCGNSTTNHPAGCYLFTVSNSGRLFSHGWFVSPNVHPRFHSVTMSNEHWTLTFKLDLCRVMVNQHVKCRGRFAWKILSTDTH